MKIEGLRDLGLTPSGIDERYEWKGDGAEAIKKGGEGL